MVSTLADIANFLLEHLSLFFENVGNVGFSHVSHIFDGHLRNVWWAVGFKRGSPPRRRRRPAWTDRHSGASGPEVPACW